MINHKLEISKYLAKEKYSLSGEENYKLGILYFNLSFYEESLSYFDFSISHGYEIEKSNKYKEFCKSFLSYISEEKESYLRNEFFNFIPNSPDTYIKWGNMSFSLESGNLFKSKIALYYYNQSITLDSSNVEVYNMRGDAKIVMGLYSDSLNDYEEALKIDSNNKHALVCKEILISIKGEITKVKISKKAYKIMSEKDYLPKFMNNSGFKYLHMEELNKMDKTIENDLDKAKLYIEEGQWELAISTIDKVLKLKPRNKQAKELKNLAQELSDEIGY